MKLAVQRASALGGVTTTLLVIAVTAFIDGVGEATKHQLNGTHSVVVAGLCALCFEQLAGIREGHTTRRSL